MTKDNTFFDGGQPIKDTRLLLIGPYPPPFGGIASHLRLLAPYLINHGVSDLAIITFGNQNSKEIIEGISIYRYRLKGQLWRLLLPNNFKLIFYVYKSFLFKRLSGSQLAQEMIKAVLINKVVNKRKINVISAYLANANLQLIPLSCYWKGRLGIILSIFGEIYEAPEFFEKHKELFHELIQVPDSLMSSSQYCAQSLRKIGITRNIEPVFYGVELSFKDSPENRKILRNKYSLRSGEIVIFFMGRMLEDMGLDVVLSTAPELLLHNPNCRFIIAGATGELTDSAYALEQNFPDRVEVMENISFSNQREIYELADVLVAPTFNQRACMGVSIKEAMAASLPVIAGAGGGIREAVVDGETGYLIPIDADGKVNKNIYIDSLKRLIDDPNLRFSLGRSGRSRAEEVFSVDRTNKRVAEIIFDVSSRL
jgi:glycosyltransferase involved in cell wall biosynthesis